MKKVSGLPTWTAVNSNSEGCLGAITDAAEPNCPADPIELRRENIGNLPAESPSLHNSTPRLTSNSSDNEAAAAAE